ncbi:MAG: hypothetical protein ACPL1Y_04965 [Thermoplasmata archaeon]
MELKAVLDEYMEKVVGLKEHCERCLNTARWHGNVVLMVVDAAFTSIGLNYFTAVVPKVKEFDKKFVVSERIKNLRDLSHTDINELEKVWKNKRSWRIAKEIGTYLSNLDDDDRAALRKWGKESTLEHWEKDGIGRICGVGLVTYQYLRMMGGVDTVMPDKIVKRVVNEILVKGGRPPVENDIEFVKETERLARECGYRPIEVCWMTWLVQEEGRKLRMEKYRDLLVEI